MPTKRGPNNTERYYDSQTGRYCHNPYLLENLHSKNTKKTFQEKEKERRESLRLQAINSKDKNLYEVYDLLEKIRPGSVKHINTAVFDKNIGGEREIDLMTDKSVYEIKSGKARHHLKQFKAQIEFAKSRNKEYVLYTPGSGKHQIDVLRKMGINAYNNIKDIETLERNKK